MADVQNTNVQEQDINQLLKVRREKLANLQAADKDPFQITKYDVDNHSANIKENFDALTDAIQKARPVSAKGVYIISCSVSATMTPGLKINLKEVVKVTK